MGCAGEQDVDIKLPPLTARTPHVPLDIPERNVPHELEEILREVVMHKVAFDAADADYLPDLMGARLSVCMTRRVLRHLQQRLDALSGSRGVSSHSSWLNSQIHRPARPQIRRARILSRKNLA